MIVFATLGAPERRRRATLRKQRAAAPEPEPTPVATGRATIIEVGEPLADLGGAQAWLQAAGETALAAGLTVLNRALYAFRLATADPYLHPVSRHQTLVARIGFGVGDEVADGRWTSARELVPVAVRAGRKRVLHPQARLAALLGARELALTCEELTLRSRLDLDHGHEREAALQLLVALDAALAELPSDPQGAALTERLEELGGRREAVAAAAQAALSGPLEDRDRQAVALTVERIEAALRARAVQNA